MTSIVEAVLAHLPRDAGIAVVRDGAATIIAAFPSEVRAAWSDDAFALLDHAATGGFWAGYVSYDLGRTVERVETRVADDLGLPDVVLARYDARLVLAPGRAPAVVGRGAARVRLHDTVERARRGGTIPRAPVTGPWFSSLRRDEHAARVAAVRELLEAGECYQVNLTRRLTAPHEADPIALFTAVHRTHPAPYQSLLTFGPAGPPVAVVSASPERFLRVRGRDLETRPIKGTATDARRLLASAKDRAENVMIVDLARNDLGRVCDFGSIEVPALFRTEVHPGLVHLVSTVRGRLRDDVGLAALFRATFPPASVTGAPKPRVLQAVEDLEPVRRGVYCGALGWIDGDRATADWAVAIRTFTVTPGATHLGVGGGIVADSDASSEWEESELKAARLLAAARGAAGATPRREPEGAPAGSRR